MARENAIHVAGIVVEALPNRTYQVELKNGHRVLAFLTRRERASFAQIAPGDRVMLEMSPYDLSEGRIILEKKDLGI
jgi:translation initiation factor IF-1